jgi:magnesium-transporting ATPase (P-type)
MLKQVTEMYERIFYRYYQWSVKMNGKTAFHHHGAFCAISLLTYTNVITFAQVVVLTTGMNVDGYDLTGLEVGILSILFCIPHYFALLHNKRYKEILKKFDRRKSNQWSVGEILIWVYTVGSLILFFGVSYLRI